MMNTVKEFEAYASVMRTEQMPLAEVIELFREQPNLLSGISKNTLAHRNKLPGLN